MSDEVPPAGGSLRSRATAGVVWTTLQTWSVRASAALAFIVISRQLMPAEFGVVALAMAVIGVLTLLSDSGMATYLVRSEKVDERIRSTAFFTSMGIAVILAGLLVALAGPVSGLFDEPGLAPVLQVLSLSVVFSGLTSVPTALLKRRMEFRSIAVRTTTATVVGSVVAVILALLGAGAWALVTQSLVRGLIALVLTWVVVKWRPHLIFDRSTARTMLGFGSRLLSIDLLKQVQMRGEDFILAGVAGTTTLGLWSVAIRLMRIVQDTGSSVISSVTLPAFARMQGELPRLHRAYRTSMTAAGLVMFPAMMFLAATSPDLVPFLLGQQWAVTGTVAQITAFTAALGTFGYFDRQVLIAVNRLRPEIILVACVAVAHVAIIWFAVPYGLVVVAIGLLARTVVTLPVRQILLHRVAGTPYTSVVLPCRVLAAAVVMAAAVWLQLELTGGWPQWLRLLVAALVAAVIYPLAVLLIARPVVKEFRGDVTAVLHRRRRRSTGSAEAPAEAAEPSHELERNRG